MSTENNDNKELDEFQEKLKAAKKDATERTKKADDLSTRFRELRRQNHFRLMLEEVFND